VRIVERSPGILAVAAGGGRVPWLCLGAFLVLAALAVHQGLAGPGGIHAERFQGALGGAAVSLVAFLFGHEDAEFRFDRSRGELAWRRRRSLRTSGGSLPLSAIQGVDVQVAMGGSRYAPRRRVVLRTAQGILPVEAAYRPGTSQECDAVAEAVRAFLEQAR
jgi:hypothetical protein